MQLLAQLSENRQGLTMWLSDIGFPARETYDGGVLVALPLAHQEMTRFDLPPVEDQFRFMIQCHEYGSRYWGPHTASVICGLTGRPLQPRRVPKDPSRFSFDARFIVPCEVVSVRANIRTGQVIIRDCAAAREDAHGFIVCRTIYQGDHQDVPGRYSQAAAAAREKAATPDVHTPIFVANGG